ncbi:MAG: bifunctional enoyl-CoA hydratase/phosphate acetyltransferase [Spirochaetales bacterium]|nr:bifunctional enoyl-CoA hydratase/phosphate acetyltransferase [Spirochaetales bacterium]
MMIRSFDELEKLAKEQPSKRVALAMAQEADALIAIVNAAKNNIVEPVLVGNKKEILKIAEEESLDIGSFPLVEAEGEAESARKAVELVRSGKADLLMKGKVATATIMKAALDKELGLRGEGILSHITIIESPLYHKLLIMTDAALNIAPGLEEKIGMVNNAVTLAKKLGVELPKVAVVGAVEKVNPAMDVTIHAAILSKMADRKQIKGCLIDGPFALDNAISAKSCEVKGITTQVGGDADVVVLPDIEAANVMYKTVAYLTNMKMAGIIVGAQVPIILTSRSDNEQVKYLSILSGVSLV